MATCICNSIKLVPRIALKRSRFLNFIAGYNSVSVSCLQTSTVRCTPSTGQSTRSVEVPSLAGTIGSDVPQNESALQQKCSLVANQEVFRTERNAPLPERNRLNTCTIPCKSTSAIVDHILEIYSETGIRTHESPKNLNCRNKYLSNSESLLKKIKAIPMNFNVLQSYCDGLQVEYKSYREKLVHSVNFKKVSLESLRVQVQALYLSEKLHHPVEEVYKVLLRKKIVVSMKQLRNSLESFIELGFDVKRLFTNIEVFRVGQKELAEFVEFSKTNPGEPILRAAQKNPRLIIQDLRLLQRNLALIKGSFPFSVNESNYFIASILKFETSDLLRRIKAIESHPQLGLLMSSPRILEIVARFPMRRNLDAWYKQYGYDSPSLNTLLRRTYIQKEETKRVYLQKDLIYFLEHEFHELKLSSQAIASSLKQHPYWLKVQLESCVATFNYLLKERKVPKSTLAGALPILFYPVNKIDAVWGYAEAARSKTSDPAFIHLLLYYLEKPYDFSGEGIWEWESPESDLDPSSEFTFSKQDYFDEDCDNVDADDWHEDDKEPNEFYGIS